MEPQANWTTRVVELDSATKGFGVCPVSGDYYVACINHALYRVNGPANGNRKVSLFAGTPGTKGATNGKRLEESTWNFSEILGLSMARSGALYVSERSAHVIRVIQDGVVSRIAGCGQPGLRDGPAQNAKFYSPISICIDESTFSIYISDCINNCIRKLHKGVVSTIAGGQSGMIDGPGVSACFYEPCHISLSPRMDHLLVSEFGNKRLRKVDLTDGNMTVSTRAVLSAVNLCHTILPSGDVLLTTRDTAHLTHLAANSNATFNGSLSTQKTSPSINFSNPASSSAAPSLSDNLPVVPITMASPNWSTMNKFVCYNPVHSEIAITAPGAPYQLYLVHSTFSYPIWYHCSGGPEGKIPVDFSLLFQSEIPQIAPVALHPSSLTSDTEEISSTSSSPAINLGIPTEMQPPEGPRFSDLAIKHLASQRTFHLHSLVCNAFTKDKRLFKSIIENSLMSAEALEFCLKTLYSGSPSDVCESLDPTLQNAKMLCHCLILYKSLDIDPLLGPTVGLMEILSFLDGDDLCALIKYIWKDCGRHSDLMEMVTPFLRNHSDLFASQALEWVPLITADPVGYARLVQQITILSASQFTPTPPTIPPTMPRSPLSLAIWKRGESISVGKKFDEPSPGTFRLSIADQEFVLDINALVLYAGWSYFRQLIHSGMTESRNNHCEFPSDFPPQLLICIVRALHGINANLKILMTPSECMYALANGARFGLVEFESKQPFQLFIPLIRYCSYVIFSSLTIENCMEQLLLRHELGSKDDIEEVVEFVCKYWSVCVPQINDLDEFLQRLPKNVAITVFQRLLALTWNKRPTKKN